VGAVQEAQHVLDAALHADRHAGDAGLEQRGEPADVDAVGVGLDGDLGAGREAELGADRVEDPREVAGGRSVGVPPPKKTVSTGRAAAPSARAAPATSRAAVAA
jgi:hypothetical protein